MITIVHFAVTIAQTYIKKTLYHFLWFYPTHSACVCVVLISPGFNFYMAYTNIETGVKAGMIQADAEAEANEHFINTQ